MLAWGLVRGPVFKCVSFCTMKPEDLSSFALPHLGDEERVKEELDLNAANDTSSELAGGPGAGVVTLARGISDTVSRLLGSTQDKR